MKPETPAKPKALRPRQIRDLYGIPQSTLHFYCTQLPEAERLPSIKLPGRRGTKGVRLVKIADLEAWLARFEVRAVAQ